MDLAATNNLILIDQNNLQALADMLFQKWNGEAVPQKSKYKEMSTDAVRDHLTKKGYKVMGAASLPFFLKMRGIEPKKRGKSNWYDTEQIEAIPPIKQ